MTPNDTTTNGEADSATEVGMLPGRAVDIVHAAMLAVGIRPYTINAQLNQSGRLREVYAQAWFDVSEQTARAVFAMLGTHEVALSEPYGTGEQLALLTGQVPVLGGALRVLVNDLPPVPPVGDVAALVAAVDAARAAQDEADVTEVSDRH